MPVVLCTQSFEPRLRRRKKTSSKRITAHILFPSYLSGKTVITSRPLQRKAYPMYLKNPIEPRSACGLWEVFAIIFVSASRPAVYVDVRASPVYYLRHGITWVKYAA